MTSDRKYQAPLPLAYLFMIVLPMGCGGLPPPRPGPARETPPTPPYPRRHPPARDLAREPPSPPLAAGRAGRSVDALTGGSPPITVAAPAWKAGYKLTSYQVADSTRTAGFDLKIPVELSLRDLKGKAVKEK